MKTTPLPEIRLHADAVPAAGEEFVMPCSVSQERFWVLDQLASGNSALNIPLAIELKGPLNIDALHKAIHAVIQRHETLRTTFVWQDDEVKQVIAPGVRFHFQRKDLSDVPEDQRTVRVLEEMDAEAVKPLDITVAPVMRAKLLHLADEYHVLLLTLHHIICDGWSNGVIVREVGVFYHAIVENREAVLPPLPIQYADYALWQKEWLKSPDFEKQLAFWEKELAGGLPTLEFPTDHPRKTGRMFPSYIESLLLPQRLSDGVKRICQEFDITVFMVLFAAYTVLIHRYTGQTRFVVGTTVANRPRPELEHLIGEFANPMMLRADLTGAPTFRELVGRVRDMSLGAMSHQEVPFELILEKIENRAVTGEKPAIQAFFLFQKAFMHPAEYGPLSLRPLRSVSPGTTFEFTLAIVERGEGIRLQFEYNTDLFEKETVRRLLRHFQILLESALDNPDAPVGELTMLAEEEKAKALQPFENGTSRIERTGADLGAVTKDLQGQLEDSLLESTDPRAALLKTPDGVRPVVLDSHLRLLPINVPGELYLGGITSGITSGALPVTGPLDAPKPTSLVRTDFVAQYREDGRIELFGRQNDFAYVGGFRVNLRQVTALLKRHPDLDDAGAAVFLNPRGPGDHLVCYVVPREGRMPSEKSLRAVLKGRINDFTLPSHIHYVPSIPRDAQGNLVTEMLPQLTEPAKAGKEDKVPLEAILYQQLIEIWIKILKVPNITIDDNFFALGGTSLQALRMMAQIEKLCGRTMPLSLLLTGATVSNLARFIVEAESESPTPLVTVQPKGTRPPVFFLHGDWAGGGFYCGRVSELLGDDQPFFALPPYRVGKQSVMTMEEMASHHIAAMQAHTPHGPYILGGYCIGATVAVEMARQLVAKGEKVTQLLLIDLPLRATPWLRWVWPFIDKLGDQLNWNLQKKIFYFDIYAVSFARWMKRPFRSKMASVGRRLGFSKMPLSDVAPGGEPGEGDMEILKSMDYAIYFLAYRLYRSRPIPAPTTLFYPSETLPSRQSWLRRVTGRAESRITVESLPGDHHTCITKHTAVLVDKMKKALAAL